MGNEYVINGSKAFISGAGSTDVLVLMARSSAPATPHLAPAASAPLPCPPTPRHHLRQKNTRWAGTASPPRTISFDNVRIPANHLLGQEGEGFKIAMKGWTAGASTSPPAPSAQRKVPSPRRSNTCKTANSLAKKHRQLPGPAVQAGRHGYRAGRRPPNGAPGRQQARRRAPATPPPTAPWPNALPPMVALPW